MRGRLVVFEGGEGSGKSTQAARLANRLGAVLTREPGGTAVGEVIRELVLHQADDLDPRAEALLMAAARAQHVSEVIAPALAEGRDVVAERFSASTLAYQGFGRGLDVEQLAGLSSWATGGVEPDVVILLEVPGDQAAARRAQRGGPPDRVEAENAAFHDRVAEGYRELARRDPRRWLVVDGVGEPDEVERRVAEALEAWERR